MLAKTPTTHLRRRYLELLASARAEGMSETDAMFHAAENLRREIIDKEKS